MLHRMSLTDSIFLLTEHVPRIDDLAGVGFRFQLGAQSLPDLIEAVRAETSPHARVQRTSANHRRQRQHITAAMGVVPTSPMFFHGGEKAMLTIMFSTPRLAGMSIRHKTTGYIYQVYNETLADHQQHTTETTLLGRRNMRQIWVRTVYRQVDDATPPMVNATARCTTTTAVDKCTTLPMKGTMCATLWPLRCGAMSRLERPHSAPSMKNMDGFISASRAAQMTFPPCCRFDTAREGGKSQREGRFDSTATCGRFSTY